MDLQKLSKKLKLFIDQQAEQMCLPIQHGNSLRIKNFVVRENSMGFLLYDIKTINRLPQHSQKQRHWLWQGRCPKTSRTVYNT